jgi:hypothetical protein
MGWMSKSVAVAVVLVMVSVAFQTAVVKAYEDGNGDGSRVVPLDGIPGPFRDLDKLVAGLLEVTVDHTDTDADGLPDTVEAVIGTDPKNTDSDLDNVPDMEEVANRTDPMEADSNGDKVPDGNEVVDGVVDSDGDGTPNAWDDDNDGDGVVDSRDLSPYAATPSGLTHHLDVQSSGRPTTISIQLRTNDPDDMRLIKNTWDWPYDTEGAMRDLDNSTDDVSAVPVLQLQGSGLVDSPELEDYGVVVVGDVAYVPLYPIEEYGGVVALQGQMFLPASAAPHGISVNASLKWKITGMSDTAVVAIKGANGLYLSLIQNDYIMANAQTVGEKQRFEVVDLKDGKYALRASNGLYLSTTGETPIKAVGTAITDTTIIQVEKRADGKRTMRMELGEAYGSGDNAISLLLGVGDLQSSSVVEGGFDGYPANSGFEWVDEGVSVTPVPLAVYPESFTVTGLYAQEEHGTDIALVYHNTSAEMALAAHMYLAYQFLRNVTTDAADIPDLFMRMNDEVGVIYGSFERLDLAMRALTESLTSAAKAGFPAGTLLPVVTAVETRYRALDLASVGQGRIGGAGGVSLDVAAQPVILEKFLKSTWYNGSTDEAVPIEDVLFSMMDWDMSTEDLATLMTLVTIWSVGEQLVLSIGEVVHPPQCSEAVDIINLTIDIISKVKTYGTIAFNVIYYGTGFLYMAYNLAVMLPGAFLGVILAFTLESSKLSAVWSLLKDGVKVVGDTWTAFSSAASGILGVLNFIGNAMKWLCVIGLVIGIASALVTVYAIGSAYQWSALGTYTAILYGVMMAAYAIIIFVLALLSFIPKVGIIFTLISLAITLSDTIVGLIWGRGWTRMLMDLIVDAVTDLTVLTDSRVTSSTTDIDMDDADGDGIDVGDRLVYTQTVKVDTLFTKLSRDEVNASHIWPATTIDVPERSASSVRSTFSTDVQFFHYENRCFATSVQEISVGFGTAMVNFPITIHPASEYLLVYEESYWLLWWHTERKVANGTASADPLTIYVDVMPSSIGDFARWRALGSADSDSDGVNDTDEVWYGRWSWDTDGDGLGDGFERTLGSNESAADSDYDGLGDRQEVLAGTDPMASDTDLDGLVDGFELNGWVVNFTYCGKEFFYHVWSDPLLNDTDADGINDRMEFLTKQNPRSRDTDGDWNGDALRDYQLTTFEQLTSFTTGITSRTPAFMAVSPDGSIYVVVSYFNIGTRTLQKWSSNGTLEWEVDNVEIAGANGIACDPQGKVYLSNSQIGVVKFDPQGTMLGTYFDKYPYDVVSAQSVAIDGNGSIYVFDYVAGDLVACIKVYDSQGSFKYQFGNGGGGSGPGGLPAHGSLEFDRKGLLYVIDYLGSRIQVFDPNGTYLRAYTGNGPGQNPLYYPSGLAFDKDGSAFISERGAKRVQKVDADFSWIANIDGSSLSNGTAIDPWDVAVTDDGTVLVADYISHGILRFKQIVTLVQVPQQPFTDTDGDGLGDAVEHVPWTINVTTAAGGTVPLLVTSDPNAPDTDLDGLGDLQEHDLGTDPRSMDTDQDGLPDAVEVDEGTDPCHFDTDGDGLADGPEINLHCDPNAKDTDGEGLWDLQEVLRGSDPRSNDTDTDGLNDLGEVDLGSNLTNADSDGDVMFDGREADVGALPNVTDSDRDGLKDGFEDVYGTNATIGDCDKDGLGDGLEVSMLTDPLSSDTDNDGVSDGVEVEQGLNPRSADSDGDGVPDALDRESAIVLDGTVYVVADPGTDTVGLVAELSKKANVVVTTPADLLADHKGARYIVLLGNPSDTGLSTAGGIIRSLLADAPDVLARMKDPSDADHIAIRYGRWAPTQTIVMLSRAFQSDSFRVIGILKGVQVKVTDGALAFTYVDPRPDLILDGVDVVQATGAAVWAHLDEATTFSVDIARLTERTVPARLTRASGLGLGEASIGRYVSLHVNGTAANASGDIVAGATIWLYYTLDDLDVSGDGYAGGAMDVGEATLALYWLDGSTGVWTRLSTALDWVTGTGLDTTDFELYGRSYAGRLWANVTHLSTFGVAGRLNLASPPTARAGPDLTVRMGHGVEFNGTASTGMGQITNYTWTFLYDGRTVTLHGLAPAFTFERAGTYRVTLNVTDMYGGTAEDSFSVKVEKAPAKVVPAWAYILVMDIFLLILLGILVVRRGREDGPEEERGRR